MFLQNKLTQLFILIVCLLVACKGKVYSNVSCDELYLYDDNTKNDTNKLQIIGKGVFDTTANMLNGIIIDSLTNVTIAEAKVYLWNGNKNYSDSTDSNGYFEFFKNNFGECGRCPFILLTINV